MLLTINHAGLTNRWRLLIGRQENAATYRSRLFLAPGCKVKIRNFAFFLWPFNFRSTFGIFGDPKHAVFLNIPSSKPDKRS